MNGSCRNPRRRPRRRCPPSQSRLLRPRPRRRRPQPRRPLLLPRRRLPQQRRFLPQMPRLFPHRPQRLPHLHWLPLQVHRFQRRVATRGVNLSQNRQRTVARRGKIAIPALVAPHHSKTIARTPSRTRYQKGCAAIPAWRGRASVASAVATGAVVNTDLLPRHARLLLARRGDRWRPDVFPYSRAARLLRPAMRSW
jgi:hypothetical protein